MHEVVTFVMICRLETAMGPSLAMSPRNTLAGAFLMPVAKEAACA